MISAAFEPSTQRPSVAVCYLARYADGVMPCARFVETYRNHAAGARHDLVVLFKGFPDLASKTPWREVFAGLNYQELDFADVGFTDLPFHKTAMTLDYDYFLFLNTWNHFITADWLAMLMRQIEQPGVGVVGATGSNESIYSSCFPQCHKGYPWPIGRRSWQRQKFRYFYPPFPNWHLRTTAFLISRDVMLRIKLPRLKTKVDAFRFESGRRSFTRQIERMGLKALVVGQNGVGYSAVDAWRSQTYRQARQENLLIADNRTISFLAASAEEQAMLTRIAWGDHHGED